jgi:hypothetical protein
MRYLDMIENEELQRAVVRKLAPPLVTLLSAEPEIQLRSILRLYRKFCCCV